MPWGFAGLAAVAAGVLAGALSFLVGPHRQRAAPVLRAFQQDGSDASGWTRRLLVMAQVAVSVVLLTGAGLLVTTMRAIEAEDLGFRTEGTLTFSVYLMNEYGALEQRVAFFGQLREAIGGLPGVRAVGGTSALPMSGGRLTAPVSVTAETTDVDPRATFLTEGASVLMADRLSGEEGDDWVLAELTAAQPGYFAAIGTSVLAGRAFTDDDGVSAPFRIIVDESVASRFWPGTVGLGERLWVAGAWREVVGVAGRTRLSRLRDPERGRVYLPYAQVNSGRVSFVVHAEGDASALLPEIQASLAAIDPLVPMADVRTTEALVRESTARDRLAAFVFSLLAAVAGLLVALGLYAVLSSDVQARARPLAVRIAMGGSRTRVAASVLRTGLGVTAPGVLLGLLSVSLVADAATPLLYGVDPGSARIRLLSAGCILIIAILASTGPVRRAVSIDPSRVLRLE